MPLWVETGMSSPSLPARILTHNTHSQAQPSFSGSQPGNSLCLTLTPPPFTARITTLSLESIIEPLRRLKANNTGQRPLSTVTGKCLALALVLGSSWANHRYTSLQISKWHNDLIHFQEPQQSPLQSYPAQDNCVNSFLSFIFTFLVKKRAEELKRDLNSHLWALQESCCVKVGKSVNFTFVFHESSEGGTVKASWARWSRAESQTQQSQVTLGFGVQKSWTSQENKNEQLSEVSLLLGIFQVSLTASPLWRPLLCSGTHEDLFTVIFFLLLYLYTTQTDGGKERRPPFLQKIKRFGRWPIK